MHQPKRKKPPKEFGENRIKRPGPETEQLLVQATGIPQAPVLEKISELDLIRKRVSPLLAEDEIEELDFAINSYLAVFQKVGGVLSLDHNQLLKRLEIFRLYQFQKHFLLAPFLPPDFPDNVKPIEKEFRELLDYFLDKKTINPAKIAFPFQTDGVAPLLSRWQAVLKNDEKVSAEISVKASKKAQQQLKELSETGFSLQSDCSCFDEFADVAFKNSSDASNFFQEVLANLKQSDFSNIQETVEATALVFAIPTGEFIECLNGIRDRFLRQEESEELRKYLFYKYRQESPQLCDYQAKINFYIKKQERRDVKASRFLKRLKD